MVEFDHRAEFTPTEIDVLEDALDDLTILPEGATPELLGRLESFREILGLTDEALPPIDVPEGLLDSVLEEARRSPAVELEGAAAPTAGLWQRLRRSLLLPGFALAATAALLIVVLKPDASPFGDMSEETGSGVAAEASEAAKAEPTVGPEGERAAAAEVPGIVPAAAPIVEEEVDANADGDEARADTKMKDEAPPPAPYELKKRPAKSKKGASLAKTADAGAGLDDPFKPEAEADEDIDAEDKTALRTLLQQADSDRQRGRCSAAVSAYSKLLGARGNEEARALMGLGLCAEREGDLATAEDYYRSAKKINPALDSLITAERKQLAAPGSESKTAKKAKPRSKKAQSLPFD